MEQVKSLFIEKSEALTVSEIRHLTGLSQAVVQQALDQLLSEKFIRVSQYSYDETGEEVPFRYQRV